MAMAASPSRKRVKLTFEEQRARALEWYKANQETATVESADPTATAIKRAAAAARKRAEKQAKKVAAVLTPVRGKAVVASSPASPVSPPRRALEAAPVESPAATTTVKKATAARKSRAKTPAVVVEDTEPEVPMEPKAAVTTASKSNSTKVKSATDDKMVPLMQHYFNALGCCIQTLLPIFIVFVFVFYASATLTGWTDENDYAKCAVIIGLVYSAVMAFYMFVLLPLIIITRAVDTALFANGATILTSSIVEISVLCLFVVGSLLVSSYSPVVAGAQ